MEKTIEQKDIEEIIEEAKLYIKGYSFEKISLMRFKSRDNVINNLKVKLKDIDSNLYQQFMEVLNNKSALKNPVIITQANLRLSGMSLNDIGLETNQSIETVRTNIYKRLKEVDEELYKRVLAYDEEREIALQEQRKEEEKQMVLKQANLFIDGVALENISLKTGQSSPKIRDNLKIKLKDYDSGLYEMVMAEFKKREKTSRSLMIDPFLFKALGLFVNSEMSFTEISHKLNVNVKKVERDMLINFPMYYKLDSSIVSEEFYQKYVNRVKEITEKKESITKTPIMKMIERMYSDESKRINFIAQSALTFGINLDSLSQILGVDAGELDKTFRAKCSLFNSLDFLFEHGFIEQKIAIADFNRFFSKLSEAYLANNREMCKQIIGEISDKKIKEFKENHHVSDALTDDDVLTILKYQLKYFIRSNDVCDQLNIDRSNYIKRVYKLAESNPLLFSYYACLMDYQRNLHFEGTGRR